jgi:isopenicillin N synthase-like dioxygenase
VAVGPAADPIVLAGHFDPGYFTIEPKATAPGLEIMDGANGQWVLVEPLLGADDLVIFACEELRCATKGYLSPTWHRVSTKQEVRFS